MKDDQSSFTFSQAANAVLQANPDLRWSSKDLKALQVGDLILVPPITINPSPHGCIEQLTYQQRSSELTYIRIGGKGYNLFDINNLNDFRERLEDAFFHGRYVNFCLNTVSKHMTMLNVRENCCECK